MAEDPVADVGHHTLADPDHEIEAQCRAQRQHRNHRQHGEEVLVDQRGIGGREAMVDDAPDGQWQDQRRCRRGQERKQRQYHLTPIGAHEGCQAEEGAQIAALGPPPGLVFVDVAHKRPSSRWPPEWKRMAVSGAPSGPRPTSGGGFPPTCLSRCSPV